MCKTFRGCVKRVKSECGQCVQFPHGFLSGGFPPCCVCLWRGLPAQVPHRSLTQFLAAPSCTFIATWKPGSVPPLLGNVASAGFLGRGPLGCSGHTLYHLRVHMYMYVSLALTEQAEVCSVVWVWVGSLPSLWVGQLPFLLLLGRVPLPTLVAGYACIFMVNYPGAAWVHMGLTMGTAWVHMG